MDFMEVVEIVFRTLYVTVTSTTIATIIGITLSIIIYLKEFKFKEELITIINSLMSTPPVIMVVEKVLYLKLYIKLNNLIVVI